MSSDSGCGVWDYKNPLHNVHSFSGSCSRAEENLFLRLCRLLSEACLEYSTNYIESPLDVSGLLVIAFIKNIQPLIIEVS